MAEAKAYLQRVNDAAALASVERFSRKTDVPLFSQPQWQGDDVSCPETRREAQDFEQSRFE